MALKLRLDTLGNGDLDDKKAELTEHLGELRTRLIRACIYCVVGMILVYAFHDPIIAALNRPIDQVTKLSSIAAGPGGVHNGSIVYKDFTGPFMLVLQISTVGGLIAALPFVIMELWGFIAPALTPQERHGATFVAPMSIVLFLMGLSCAYLILPMAVKWFLGFLPKDAVLLQDPLTYIVFVVKLLLVFGLLFQLPVVLMFLGKVGIINSALMIQYWRQIAVGLFTLAMVVAPSNDPGTMLALAIPLTILFFGSIGLVKMVEPKTPAV